MSSLYFKVCGTDATTAVCTQGCRNWGGGDHPPPPQILADQLFLFQPEGEDYICPPPSPLGFLYPPMALSTIVSSSSTRTPNYILRGTYVRLPKVCPSVIIKLLHLIRLGIQKPLYRQDSQWSGFSMQFLISCKNVSFIILKINPKIQKESKICIT